MLIPRKKKKFQRKTTLEKKTPHQCSSTLQFPKFPYLVIFLNIYSYFLFWIVVRSGSQALANVCSAAESHQFFEAHFVKLIEGKRKLLRKPREEGSKREQERRRKRRVGGKKQKSREEQMFAAG